MFFGETSCGYGLVFFESRNSQPSLIGVRRTIESFSIPELPVEWSVVDTELILCGADGTGRVTGASLGPFALWHQGIETALRALTNLQGVHTMGPCTIGSTKHPGFPPESPATLESVFDWLRAQTFSTLSRPGCLPVYCLGDHTFSAATVGKALEIIPDLHVLWVDAHADTNTPATSPSGNLHGMPASMLMHETVDAAHTFSTYSKLLPKKCLRPEALHFWGIRDLDPAERDILRRHTGLVATMSDIDRYSTAALADKLLERIPDGGSLWVSFDVDSVDPLTAPGTGTPVPEGLTKREAFTLAEILASAVASGRIKLAGVEVVEVNPLLDNAGASEFAVVWVASILGKSIL
jgi:arginase